MPDKAYAILLNIQDEDNGELYFPIKREGLQYGGMPQFFGGTKDPGESDRQTIAREMNEESDGQLTLESGGLRLVHHAVVGGSNYNFYVATNFKGAHFLGPLKNNEMQSIEKFLVQVGQGDDVEDLLRRLKIVPSQEFTQSETYAAFNAAIAYSESDTIAVEAAAAE